MKKFKDQDEAEAEVKKLNEEFLAVDIGFCPLIKGTCNPKCVCFAEAIADAGFWVYEPRCVNSMFFGKEI